MTFKKQADVLFARFDKDKDGLINYEDFQIGIVPLKTYKQNNNNNNNNLL